MSVQLNLRGGTICHNGYVISELGPTLKLATCSIVYKRSGRKFYSRQLMLEELADWR